MPTKSRSSTTTERVNKREFANPFHPGEILLTEFLEPMGKTQAAFAAELGWTTAKLNEIVRGRRGVTADSAIALANALGTTAKFWMNFQTTYDLDSAMKKRKAA